MPTVRRPLVLIVEDDPHQAQLLAVLLESDGYAVHLAPDAEAALCALADVLPDLITLDLNLPGMSGAELLHQLRAEPRTAQLPVLLITAYPSVPPATVALAQTLITKPYDIDVLLAVARRFVATDAA